MSTPHISSQVGRSPSTSSAPINVQIGPVARIGEAIETGRCLTAKYEQTHDIATIVDLSRSWPCWSALSGATTRPGGGNRGQKLWTAINASHTDALQTLAKNSTGRTAFSRTA